MTKPDSALTSDKILVQIEVVTADGVIAQEIYNQQVMAYTMNSTLTLDVPATTGNSTLYVYYDGVLVNTQVEEYTPPVNTEPPAETTENVGVENTGGTPENTEGTLENTEGTPENTQGTPENTQDVGEQVEVTE